ncbi:NADH-ubiquinone oxidoreductase-F iron-sulfur binding region domain-containing protein [Pusillimonas noertemannii]|uniref:Bidirectional [NiFe] hydrogenase diaphorase subunit n=1 Tax=Pusillimonas noertemannii TaxID=305977 RepID=A0A2U1CNZ7_9BURK|nr:hypothetical protein [Pusillimonas noertemannii]PVY62738.1 bidirectional [NiFe] hydrogenase diaphorase subunit [Pusillimonas noertemannii]
MLDIFDRRQLDAGASWELPAYVKARRLSPGEICAQVAASGLIGKGGAGFPVSRKLELIMSQAAGTRHVVINGGEHEPGSAKDRHLLEEHPLTVFEGALILAHTVSANVLHFAVPESATGALEALRDIKESFMRSMKPSALDVRISPVPETYLLGEESALLEMLNGRPPIPRERPPFPIQEGIDGKPTLVHNVETAAHLPYILLHGPSRYRALSPAGLGVALCTFGPEFVNSGVRLVPLGISLHEIVMGHGGGLISGKPIRAVQTGGPSGGFLGHDELDVPFDHASLQKAGASLGCGVIRAFDEDADLILELSRITEFFMSNSCGQCPGCRMQTQVLHRIMQQTLAGEGSEKLLAQAPIVIKANAAKGICGFIRMPGPPVLSALEKFRSEFARDHIKHHAS